VLIHNTSSRAWGMDKLLPMVRSTAAGIRVLHARGRPVLHRDLKPGNIFVGTGQHLKVGDFGMSRYVDLVAAAGAGNFTSHIVSISDIGSCASVDVRSVPHSRVSAMQFERML